MLTDPLLEGYRIVDTAGKNNLVVRLIGGLGVAAHDHRPLPPELEREFAHRFGNWSQRWKSTLRFTCRPGL